MKILNSKKIRRFIREQHPFYRKGKNIKIKFLSICDEYIYSLDGQNGYEFGSIRLGISKLRYNDLNKTLTVYLRKPILLKGIKGRIINKITNELGYKIKIVHTNLIRD